MFLNGKESEDRDSTLLASFVSIDIKLAIRVRSELEAMELHDWTVYRLIPGTGTNLLTTHLVTPHWGL